MAVRSSIVGDLGVTSRRQRAPLGFGAALRLRGRRVEAESESQSQSATRRGHQITESASRLWARHEATERELSASAFGSARVELGEPSQTAKQPNRAVESDSSSAADSSIITRIRDEISSIAALLGGSEAAQLCCSILRFCQRRSAWFTAMVRARSERQCCRSRVADAQS